VAVAITARSATGTVVERLTFAHIDLTGVDDNDADGLEKRYYLIASLTGQDNLRSHVFGPSSDGKHTWDNVMFPADGGWTVELRDVEDDSVVATETITVAAEA
jgi:hypothetical protein